MNTAEKRRAEARELEATARRRQGNGSEDAEAQGAIDEAEARVEAEEARKMYGAGATQAQRTPRDIGTQTVADLAQNPAVDATVRFAAAEILLGLRR